MQLNRKRILVVCETCGIGFAITRVCLAEGTEVFAIGQDGGART